MYNGEEENTTPITCEQQTEAHYVYIVRCVDGTLYTGYTTNIEQRIATHNAGKGGRYTRAHRPVTLVASWIFPTKHDALSAEYAFKSLSRAQKLQYIESSAEAGLPFPPSTPL